jgi:autophagy-related protein 5
VIYDLLVPLHDVEPWPLTLHVRGFPSAVLPACGGEPALRGALLNSLKEAAFICSGTAERVQAMSAGPQDDLWRAVVSADARRHSEVLGSLQLSRPGERQSLSVPVRIFIRDAAGGQYLSSYAGIRYTSRPVAARRPDGAPATLLDALRPLVEADAGGDVENKLSRVYVGGVLPPLDAPLAALHARLRGPDHFLYVVAHLAVPSAAGAATNPI